MNLDLEVLAGLSEGRVCGFWEDHFGLRHAAFGVCLVARREAGHEDGFGAAARGDAYAAFGGVKER